MSVDGEEKDDWIRKQLDDEDADKFTEGWDKLSEEYWHLQENLQGYYDEAELNWYENNSYSEMHDSFLVEINELKEILNSKIQIGHEQAIYKMIYAHAVTLLESFLSDTVKSLIVSNDKFFANAAKHIDELKKARFSLIDVAKQEQSDVAVGLAIMKLSDVLYHNMPKVKRIYESVLGTSLDTDISKVNQITSTRHDIVHRNGKTITGDQIDISKELVEEAVKNIESFVNALQISINKAGNA